MNTLTVTITSCAAKLQAVKPSSITGSGWKVQYFNGSAALTTASTTIGRSVTLAPGSYAISATWTKAGQASIQTPAVAVVVPSGGTSVEPVPVPVPVPTPVPVPSNGLIGPANLVLKGSFRLPSAVPDTDATTFDYGGYAMAFNPAGDGGKGSLILAGHQLYRRAAEISIPTPVNGPVNTLPTATILTGFTDILQGRADEVIGGGSSNYIGGLLVDGQRLLASVYVHYDANALARKSHFVTSFPQPNVSGPFEIGTRGAGWVAGAMCAIPAAWQGPLGGTHLTGQWALSIISRTSAGPTATVFNAADLGVVNPVPGTCVLGYPITHPTLGGIVNGQCEASGDRLFDCTTVPGGMVFPEGTNTVLFFGRVGKGQFCYGPGTDKPELHGQPDGEGGTFCYDPAAFAKGGHAYPYAYKVMAYDAADLVAVKNGQKQTWEVVPYASWDVSFPASTTEERKIISAAYNPSAGEIYVATAYGEFARPLVHVWQIQ